MEERIDTDRLMALYEKAGAKIENGCAIIEEPLNPVRIVVEVHLHSLHTDWTGANIEMVTVPTLGGDHLTIPLQRIEFAPDKEER